MRIKSLLHIILILLCVSTSLWAGEILHTKVTGITGTPLKNVQDRLDVIQHTYDQNITEKTVQSFYEAAPENIRQALQPFGYFKPKIISSLKKDSSGYTTQFSIAPGPALLISKIELKIMGAGKENTELSKLSHDFPIKSGQPLQIENYNKALTQLLETANNQGYLKAAFEKKEVRIDLKKYSAKIILYLNTGERYYFGNVNFNDSPFATKFLHRFVRFNQQQAFSSEKLLKLQQDMGNSQYFQQVLINPQLGKTIDNHVPIDVETIPRKSQQFVAGLGYGTFTGPRFTAGVDLRRVTDTGQHFNMQLKLSPVLRGLAAKYFIPGKNPLSDLYTIGANLQEFIPRNGRSFSENLSSSYVKTIDEWQHTLSLTYLRERFTSNNNPWLTSNLLYPSLSISRIKSDDLLNPRNGSAINFNLQGANQHLLSQIDFVQTELKGKLVISPTEPSRLIFRGDLGYTVVKDLQKLPMTLQFFAGGPNSVRGYRYDSMGPGRYLKVGSAEYQHKIYGNWSGALFYDAGIASDHFNASSQHSRGVGVVYNSFIGPIKLYLSRADSSPGRPFRIDFNIGPDF